MKYRQKVHVLYKKCGMMHAVVRLSDVIYTVRSRRSHDPRHSLRRACCWAPSCTGTTGAHLKTPSVSGRARRF